MNRVCICRAIEKNDNFVKYLSGGKTFSFLSLVFKFFYFKLRYAYSKAY